MKVQADFVQVQQPLSRSEKLTSSSSSSTISKPKSNNFSKLKVLYKINNSRFPVYLVYSEVDQKKRALKVFPYTQGQINQAYLTESRFSSLIHPNVVSIIDCCDKQKSTSGNKKYNASCTLMEYAPYGDFADLVLEKKIYKDEILSRTFFHHLIEGIEYLHSKGMAHMDLKLENLLLGEDYKLKIADFDLSYIEGDKEVRSRGTCHYRAPEVLNKCTRIPKRADLYSLGIILFIFKTGGFPCLEDVLIEGHNLNELMLNEDSQFWKVHKKIQNKNVVLDQDFKDLFMSLVKRNSSKRASLEDIKKSKWYNGPIYRDCEMVSRLAELCIFKAQEEVAED